MTTQNYQTNVKPYDVLQNFRKLSSAIIPDDETIINILCEKYDVNLEEYLRRYVQNYETLCDACDVHEFELEYIPNHGREFVCTKCNFLNPCRFCTNMLHHQERLFSQDKYFQAVFDCKRCNKKCNVMICKNCNSAECFCRHADGC